MSPKPSRPYRRRQLIVDRPFQFRFVGTMVLFFCALIVLTLGAIYVALWGTLYTFELLHDETVVALCTTAGLVLALELLLLTPPLVWVGVLLTHKVVGPLVRIRAALAQLEAGHYEIHVTLRKGDQLLELADDINRLAASLRRARSPHEAIR